jgi:hypothetical protein
MIGRDVKATVTRVFPGMPDSQLAVDFFSMLTCMYAWVFVMYVMRVRSIVSP